MRHTKLSIVLVACGFGILGAPAAKVAPNASFVQDSDQANAYYGFAVAPAGDVNGDGFSDIVVGAYNYNGGSVGEGRVSIYHGGPTGASTTAARTLERDQAGAEFGFSVASAGDFNGDGFDDVIVGAPHYNGNGAIFIYFGSATGIPATPGFTFAAAQANSNFGASVSGAGDVNNDGFDDVIVGASVWDGSVGDEGAAFVFHGGASNPATWAWMVEPTNQANSLFGASVSRAGDVNGDGYADVVIGAPGHTLGQATEGSITVYHGGSSGLSTTIARQVDSDLNTAQLGFSVAAAGDVNGDGYADVVAGAPHLSNGQGNEGRVYVFHGSSTGIGASANRTLEENQVSAELGWSVATAGDVNGDGYADIIAGAHLWTNGSSDEGAAFIYLGSPSGIPATHAWTEEINEAGAEFGRAVATAGDTDGDGFSEVLIGSPLEDNGQTDEGMARIYDGGGDLPGTIATRFLTPSGANDLFGSAIAVIGDVNGDGYTDAAIYQNPNGGSSGPVQIYFGSASGLPAAAAQELFAPDGLDPTYFGLATIAGAGDVNGDGYDDLLVGSGYHATSVASSYIFLGSATGLAAAPAWSDVVRDEGSEDAGLGDVNGDGYGDWAVREQQCYYRVLHGGASLPASGTEARALNADANGNDECRIAGVGDTNRDGFDDVVVIGYHKLFFFYGSRNGLQDAQTVPQPALTDFLTVVAAAGDVNGDGYADVVIGRPLYPNDPVQSGRVEVWFGSAGGIETAPAWVYEPPPATESAYGYAVGSPGDVDGDGYSDIVAFAPYGSPQRADVFLGSVTGPSSSPSGSLNCGAKAHSGGAFAVAADFNGDGFGDVLVSEFEQPGRAYEYLGNGGVCRDHRARLSRVDQTAPIALHGKSDSSTSFRINSLTRPVAGRNDVRMDHEAVPLGTPFGGAIFKGTYFDSGVPGSNGSDINFGRLVSGLSGGPSFTFRFRFTSRNPLFPHTRWFSLPGNPIRETDLCLPQTWYHDADNDGYGDSATAVFQCTAPSGWVTVGTDCDDTTSQIHPGGNELCNGLDDDCDLAIDEGIAVPVGIQKIWPRLVPPNQSLTHIYWFVSGATSEATDVVRGSLSALRATGGDFTASIEACQANNRTDNPVFSAGIPAVGDGYWFLSRATNCAGVSTYDDGSATQAPGRNAEIVASPNNCP